jgi:hypothetical protein
LQTPQQSPSFHPHIALTQKLHPNRFSGMSTAMAAIVGFIIGERFTQPSIAEIVVTSDGLVLARTDGEASETHLIGSYADVLQNWLRLIAVAGLSASELTEAQASFAAKIGFFGRETA